MLIGVPIIIHLLGERKYQAISFSSLKFLREIERDSLQKLHLRQLLVLLARALWIALLVLAIAQPFFSSAGGSLEPGIILIDKSFSTSIDVNYTNKEKDLIENLPRWDNITYDEKSNSDSLREQILTNIENNKRENPNIILLSDFQENRQNRQIIDFIKTLTTRAYGLPLVKEKENFALSNIRVMNENSDSRDMKNIEVQLSKNVKAITQPSIHIKINGKQAGRTSLNEKGYGDFHFSTPENDYIPCIATCSDDEYPEDNVRYLVIRNRQKTKILCINEEKEANYHLKALRAMEQVDITEIRPEKLLSINLDQYDMLWFSNLYPISLNAMKAISIFARDNPILIVAGQKTDQPSGWESVVGNLTPVKDESGFYRVKDIYRTEGSADFHIKRFYRTSLKPEKILWELASNDPLLMEADKNIYLLLSPFHFDWNEMGLSPYFTRVIGDLIIRLCENEELLYETGDIISIKEPFSKVLTPTGEQYQIKDIFSHTNTPGFYAVESAGRRKIIAVNIPADESVQDQIKTEDIKILEWNGRDIADIEKQIKGRNTQTFFYILALLFFILEMLLLRKGERTK
ncbi:MAG: BatA domain-containing protein [Candidatus Marinimicrobia bacterium]|nr:BatA domain-containing protein [Candidatus Neomarinimicrobiota bacterium]